MLKSRFIHYLSIFALVLSLTLSFNPVAADSNDADDHFTLNVMHMNDTHAHVDEYPKLITAINEYRDAHEDALLFHAGDVFSGTLYYTVHKGQADVDLMNLMGLDAMVFGNHEFDEGSKEEHHETLSEFVKAADFPLLGTNIDFSKDKFMTNLVSDDKFSKEADDGKVYDGIILEVDGEEIGVFGLTTEDTYDISSPNHVDFTNYIEAAKEAVDYFESQDINKIIAVNHIGYDTGAISDLTLAEEVDGIDIIVGGHSHTKLDEPVLVNTDSEPTVIVQADQYASHLGTLEVEFDENGVIVDHSGELIPTKELAEDKEAVNVLDKYKDEVEEMANERVCNEDESICAEAMKDLENPRLDTDETSVRAHETELGNLVTDAMLYGAKKKFPETVIAVQNGGGIRAPIDAGPITVGEVINVLPFGNDPVIVDLSGEEIKEMLERSVKSYPNEDGGFLHVSGMKYEFDSDEEPGERVHTIYVNIDGEWEELSSGEKYTVTTNGFTGEGGDDHEVFKRAFDEGRVSDIGEIDWEQLRDYMLEELEGEIDPEIEGRIVDKEKDEDDDDQEPGDDEDDIDNGSDNGDGNENDDGNDEGNDNGNDEDTDDDNDENGDTNEIDDNGSDIGDNDEDDKDKEEGKELPKTATNAYNYILVGALLILSSLGILIFRRFQT